MAMLLMSRGHWITPQHIVHCHDDLTAQPPTLHIWLVPGGSRYEPDFKLQGDECDAMLVWLRTQAATPLAVVGEA